MQTTYSLKKGFGKGLVSVLVVFGALVAFAGFSDMTIWDMLVKYVQPLLGSLTVGGAIAMLTNYLKVKLSNSNSTNPNL